MSWRSPRDPTGREEDLMPSQAADTPENERQTLSPGCRTSARHESRSDAEGTVSDTEAGYAYATHPRIVNAV